MDVQWIELQVSKQFVRYLGFVLPPLPNLAWGLY
jgi:hypothetical protein